MSKTVIEEVAVESAPQQAQAAPQPPRYSERELGLANEDGSPVAPETREIRYSMRELWPAAIELGKQVGLSDQGLYELARQFHSVRPAGWRHELLDALNARLLDPASGMTSEFRRGLRDLVPDIQRALAELESELRPLAAEAQLKALRQLLRYLNSILGGLK